jgi:protein-S-isoprenylcysteine O-methyltransferase Ste14
MSLDYSRVARRIRVPLGFAFAAFYLWRAKPSVLSLCVGTLLIVMGLGTRALAAGHVRKNMVLTTTGPYAYTRNPLYLGSILIGTGFALAARDLWIGLALVAFFVLIYVPVIRSEEAYLRRTFPDFDAYARRVPRLLPRISRRETTQGTFSRQLYFKHREYQAALGAAAMLGALVVKLYRPDIHIGDFFITLR